VVFGVDPVDSDASSGRGPRQENGWRPLIERIRNRTANVTWPVFDVHDYWRARSTFQPPLADAGLVVLCIDVFDEDDHEAFVSWVATALPDVECYDRFAFGTTRYCLVHEIENESDVLGAATTFIDRIDSLAAAGDAFLEVAGYGYVIQEIDAAGFEPLDRSDYETDLERFSYITDGLIDGMSRALHAAAATDWRTQ
jgi:hypothetical protein